jgi:GT2 family glycosyltransferase
MSIKIKVLELAEEIKPIRLLEAQGSDIWLLVRLKGEPVGWLKYSYQQLPMTAEQIAQDIARFHTWAIYEHSIRRMLDNGQGVLQTEQFLNHAFYNPEPPVSPDLVSVLVLIPPKFNCPDLETCLEALKNQIYQNQQVICVSFAEGLPFDIKETIQKFGADLIWGAQAFRKAVNIANGEIILITGANGVPDKTWVKAAVQAIDTPHIAGVSGPLFPLELEHPAQIEFERNAKRPVWFTRYYHYDQVYSIQPETFGTSLNFAFQKNYLVGQIKQPLYDHSFGITQLLELCYEALKQGYMIGYEPQAIVWERYPTDLKEAWRQIKQEGKERSDYLATALKSGLTSGQLTRLRVKTAISTSRNTMQMLREIKARVTRAK